MDPGDQAIRVFWNPTPFAANPDATYKILVNGRAGGFRHQAIVDAEAMFQKLGAENGFDVDIYDPNINGSPGRQAPAGVSLATSPFLDLATLTQYKTIVFELDRRSERSGPELRPSSRTSRRTSGPEAA